MGGTWRERVADEDREQERLRVLAEKSAQRRAEAIHEGLVTEFGGNAAAMGRELGKTRAYINELRRRALRDPEGAPDGSE
ncbi:hypothetical protein [Embleya sp. NPDC005971]|uniref:hypothetical protein n=1 Tax=Embleya sp. NPDC005971 TaxID=3156724 RepID=UPI0033DD56FB